MSIALRRTGTPENQDKYFTLQFQDGPKETLSVEFIDNEIRDHVAISLGQICNCEISF